MHIEFIGKLHENEENLAVTQIYFNISAKDTGFNIGQ